MEIINDRKIKNITLLYPEIMSDDAINKIKKLYYDILEKKDELYDLREKVIDVENEVNKLQEMFDVMSDSIFTIEFETIEKDYKINKTNIGFNMSAEINKNLK